MAAGKKMKYAICCISGILLLFLTASASLGFGIWLNVDHNDWKGISDYDYISLANVLFATGVIVYIVTLLGCYGACVDKKTIIIMFAVFLMAPIVMEIGVGTAAEIWSEEIEDELRGKLEERIPGMYYTDPDVKKAMDSIQDHFECCGVNGISDWEASVNGQAEIDSSCCITETIHANYSALCRTIDYPTTNTTLLSPYYQKGCYDSIEDFVVDKISYIRICSLIVAMLQLAGMVCVVYASLN